MNMSDQTQINQPPTPSNAMTDSPSTPITAFDPDRLSLEQAAEYCGYSPATFRDWLWSEQGPRYRRGCTLFFRAKDLDDWMYSRGSDRRGRKGRKSATVPNPLSDALGVRGIAPTHRMPSTPSAEG